MANNLLDTIRQSSGQIATQQQGVTDDTAQAQKLLRAKSGKASAGGPVAVSNLGEQQAVANTNAQMQGSVAPEAAIQTGEVEQEAAGIQNQNQEQRATIAEANKYNGVQARIQTTSFLNDMARRNGELDIQKDNATVQQIATNLRLQNDKYINNLQLEGARSRLDDQNQFNQELEQTILGDNKDLLEKQLGDKSIVDVQDNEYKKALGDMTIDQAYSAFKNKMKQDKQGAIFGAAGKGAQSAIGGAAGGESQPAPTGPSNQSPEAWQAQQGGQAEVDEYNSGLGDEE